jgi:hypothetical protein
MNATLQTSPSTISRLHSEFLSILPRIRAHAEFTFRFVRCSHDFDDFVAETVALAWKWFVRLVEQGKNPTQFPTTLASYAVRAVRAGRRLCGQEASKDALSPTAQQRRQFVVTKLPDVSTLEDNPLQEALIDNTQSPVPDQVVFRIDWPRWHRRQEQRTRKIITAMALGHRTGELAQGFDVSPSRISQLRQELRWSWKEFIRELPVNSRPGPSQPEPFVQVGTATDRPFSIVRGVPPFAL